MSSPNIWYRYVAAGTGGVTVSLAGSQFDTKLAVYAGAGCYPQAGAMIECNDDFGNTLASQITFQGTAGEEYLIEVGGYNDLVEVLDFELVVDQTGGCPIPLPDGFEPDDHREAANRISKPTSIPTHANGWGRANSEIHAHSIFPLFDVDQVQHVALVAPGLDLQSGHLLGEKKSDAAPHLARGPKDSHVL